MTLPALAPPDYGMLPPEINSGRIYAGPGSASLAASAAAWQALAAQLGSTAAAFQAVVDGLAAGAWEGPSSISMATAAAPYVAWMTATAGQAEQAAASAVQAAETFEAARAGVVPPPVIEANRDMLETLIATNFLGVNTPAIAATEAAYQEFWAQDATVMYGYSADAAVLTSARPRRASPRRTPGRRSQPSRRPGPRPSNPPIPRRRSDTVPQPPRDALSVGRGGCGPLCVGGMTGHRVGGVLSDTSRCRLLLLGSRAGLRRNCRC